MERTSGDGRGGGGVKSLLHKVTQGPRLEEVSPYCKLLHLGVGGRSGLLNLLNKVRERE